MGASNASIQATVAGTPQEGALADVIAAINISRFSGGTIQAICAMAVKRAGRKDGRKATAAHPSPLSRSPRVRALPLQQLEALSRRLQTLAPKATAQVAFGAGVHRQPPVRRSPDLPSP